MYSTRVLTSAEIEYRSNRAKDSVRAHRAASIRTPGRPPPGGHRTDAR